MRSPSPPLPRRLLQAAEVRRRHPPRHVYDGTGAAGKAGDVAILDDRIAAVGDLAAERGREEVDATGLAVAPGFINMLSHSETSLIEDGRVARRRCGRASRWRCSARARWGRSPSR